MATRRKIDWQKLAEIPELEGFFEANFEKFKAHIEGDIKDIEQFSDESLDKIAKLRALEVTNGVTQWAFRRGDEQAISVEKARVCMNVVMGFMKKVELDFPSIGKVAFTPEEKAFVCKVRATYMDAFKHDSEEAKQAFYANSTAQFIVCGHERLEAAMALVKQDYEEMFSPYYTGRGQGYIRSYLESFEEVAA